MLIASDRMVSLCVLPAFLPLFLSFLLSFCPFLEEKWKVERVWILEVDKTAEVASGG